MRNLFRLLTGWVFLVALPASVFSQNPAITGTVTDISGAPVAGANIVIKSTSRGTVSDAEGKFKLSVPTNAILVISQLTLRAWLREYPDSYVMQPDTFFKNEYKGLEGYDQGTIKSSLEKRDSSSWNRKSWVIGVIKHSAS